MPFKKYEYDIYFAGPLFTDPEREWNWKLCCELRKRWKVYFPWTDSKVDTDSPVSANEQLFLKNRNGIVVSRMVMAVLDGADQDSGTSWECGFCHGLSRPYIGVRTDFRGSADDGGYNLMLSRAGVEMVQPPFAECFFGETYVRLVRALEATLDSLPYTLGDPVTMNLPEDWISE